MYCGIFLSLQRPYYAHLNTKISTKLKKLLKHKNSFFHFQYYKNIGPNLNKHKKQNHILFANHFQSENIGFKSKYKDITKFIKNNFLPIGLITSILLGHSFPDPANFISELHGTKYCTICIFIISGLLLQKGEAEKALSSWKNVIFGSLSILLFTPLVSLLLVKFPLRPIELSMGMSLFTLSPATLSTGVTMTQIAGGNVAMALLLTILTNSLAVFTMPFTIAFVFENIPGSHILISPVILLLDLIKTVLIPTIIGYLIRSNFKSMDNFVNENKSILSMVNSSMIILIAWMNISQTVKYDLSVSPDMILLIICLGSLIHASYLIFNTICVNTINFNSSNDDLKRAVILVTSQKTLAISVTLISQLTPILGPVFNIAIIPCILLHITQISFDSFLVSSWQRKNLID